MANVRAAEKFSMATRATSENIRLTALQNQFLRGCLGRPEPSPVFGTIHPPQYSPQNFSPQAVPDSPFKGPEKKVHENGYVGSWEELDKWEEDFPTDPKYNKRMQNIYINARTMEKPLGRMLTDLLKNSFAKSISVDKLSPKFMSMTNIMNVSSCFLLITAFSNYLRICCSGYFWLFTTSCKIFGVKFSFVCRHIEILCALISRETSRKRKNE